LRLCCTLSLQTLFRSHPDAVEAAVVEYHRRPAAHGQQRVAAGDARVVEHDLVRGAAADVNDLGVQRHQDDLAGVLDREVAARAKDRKSTRLNSSHEWS